MELINSGRQITPHRLHALVRLVSRLENPTQEDLLNFLQPPGLIENQKAAREVFKVAKQHNLITENLDKGKTVSLHKDIDPSINIELVDEFRACMREKLLGINEDGEDNYLFNLFTAWYAVQNERVFGYTKKDIIIHFNTQLFPYEEINEESEGRALSDVKLNAWLEWAAFLGFGWFMRLGTTEILVPDAYDRLKAILPTLLPQTEEVVTFRDFSTRLTKTCPELDNGSLFEKCWQASRGAEIRGNQLSLMLSTGLRTLHYSGHIELIRQADASDIWRLYPAEGYSIQEITHIRLKG